MMFSINLKNADNFEEVIFYDSLIERIKELFDLCKDNNLSSLTSYVSEYVHSGMKYKDGDYELYIGYFESDTPYWHLEISFHESGSIKTYRYATRLNKFLLEFENEN